MRERWRGRAQTTVEFGFIIAIVIILCLAAVFAYRDQLSALYSNINRSI